MIDLINGLNERQKEAVLHTGGPILILAGAGSGKTSVLTRKIAYLIKEKNIKEYNILAFTFTNKAANEMKERIGNLLNKDISHMWVGTFHSICSRILRRNIERLGYKSNFSIYDTGDTKSLIKVIAKDLRIDSSTFRVGDIISEISNAKNRFESPDYMIDNSTSTYNRNIGEIYKEYEKRKKKNNALDFDDLILKTVKLLKNNKDVCDYYADEFKQVFVDEYQDTNKSQYELIKLLSKNNLNVCVVGDSDQSIYSWRGADTSNIQNFEKDFKNVKVIILEQNYRSTTKILDAANTLIKNNSNRKEKNLWSNKDNGEEIKYINLQTDRDEARYVVQKIEQMYGEGFDFREMAILYRTNSQSREFEEQLMRNDIPHQVVGGLKFYDRREVKDMLTYLAFIANPDDNLSLKRIINMPKRGIGDTTVDKLENYAIKTNQSIYDAVHDENIHEVISGSTLKKVQSFINEMTKFIDFVDDYTVLDLVNEVYEVSGYKKMLENSKKIEDKTRIDNISQLVSAISEFDKNNQGSTLQDYLQNVNLLSDVDKTEVEKGVSLMTVHAAKGLEFDVVFLTGMNENLFPSTMTDTPEGEEEERRLCYVAITRARKILFISSTSSRMVFATKKRYMKSPFIEEIKNHIVEEEISYKENEDDILEFMKSFESLEAKRDRIKKEVLSNKKQFNDVLNMNFNIGDKVAHKKFGNGMIVSINGDELTISFENKGIKKLNSKIAMLKKM